MDGPTNHKVLPGEPLFYFYISAPEVQNRYPPSLLKNFYLTNHLDRPAGSRPLFRLLCSTKVFQSCILLTPHPAILIKSHRGTRIPSVRSTMTQPGVSIHLVLPSGSKYINCYNSSCSSLSTWKFPSNSTPPKIQVRNII